MDRFKERLLESGYEDLDDLVGCSEEEILEVQEAAGFELPNSYKAFLHLAGRGGGDFKRHVCMFYPRIIQGNKNSREDNSGILDNPESTFTILIDDHAGSFYYFRSDEGDNPPVYAWVVGMDKPSKEYDCFWDFMEGMFSEYR